MKSHTRNDMTFSKELIKDLRVMIASQETFHHDVAKMSFEHAKALLDEIERLQVEVDRLKEYEWKYNDLCK